MRLEEARGEVFRAKWGRRVHRVRLMLRVVEVEMGGESVDRRTSRGWRSDMSYLSIESRGMEMIRSHILLLGPIP